MSEQHEIPCPGFIDSREWVKFDVATQSAWANFVRQVGWLMEQPQFRAVMKVVLDDPRFCGTDRSPIRASPEHTYHAIGVQDAGRALRLVLQTVSPRMWMRLMHEAFNASKE